MDAQKGCMAVLMVVLATGCLEKPAPWVPGDGMLQDAVVDGEAAVGDGPIAGDLPKDLDLSLFDGDATRQELSDGDGLPDDKSTPEVADTAFLDMLPDADLPEVVGEGPVLRGAIVCPGIGGAWEGRPYRVSVTWHRNTFVKGE